MKKYLVKGALALFAGTLIYSCAEQESEYVPVAQQKVKAFEEVFKEVYGDIDPYQTWGFNSGKIDIDLNDSSMVMEVIDVTDGEEASTRSFSRAQTRTINVNGNEWEEIPECTQSEATKVFNYVNMTRAEMTAAGHKYADDFPYNFTDFFVTQVWTGQDTYSTVDGTSTGVLGSSKMNHLNIGMRSNAKIENGVLKGTWEHINNFNASDNRNYGGNTLVVNGGTWDFAYHCTEDSRYHNRWIAVKGEDVAPSLAGKYYICFDFMAENPEAYTVFRFKLNGTETTASVPGAWTVASATTAKLKFTASVTTWVVDDETTWEGHNETKDIEVTVGGEGTSDWSIDNVVGGNKVINPNDVYTDWIVRIVPATKFVPQPVDVYHNTYEDLWNPVEAGRVFCEDLGKASREDLDYNDLVFDARIWSYKRKTIKWKWHYVDSRYTDIEPESKTEVDWTESEPTYYADIKLLAAGGTIPITIAGRQVHDLFSADVATMINTRDNNSTAYGSYDTRSAVVVGDASKGDEYRKFKTTNGSEFELWLIPGYSSIKSIPIVSAFNWKDVKELGAETGEAPHKIMVQYGTTKWTSERKNISLAYPNFGNYVTGQINNTGWVDEPVGQYLYLGAVQGEYSPAPQAILSSKDEIGDAERILWSGSESFGTSWAYKSLSSPYFMGEGFYPGDRIRFHGIVTAEGDNSPIITVSFADDSQPYLIENRLFAEKNESGTYPTEAYVEVTLDQSLCDRMNNSKVSDQITLHIQGCGFTLTQIGFVP